MGFTIGSYHFNFENTILFVKYFVNSEERGITSSIQIMCHSCPRFSN